MKDYSALESHICILPSAGKFLKFPLGPCNAITDLVSSVSMHALEHWWPKNMVQKTVACTASGYGTLVVAQEYGAGGATAGYSALVALQAIVHHLVPHRPCAPVSLVPVLLVSVGGRTSHWMVLQTSLSLVLEILSSKSHTGLFVSRWIIWPHLRNL